MMAATSPFLVLARQLSTSAASQALIKAPVRLFSLEGRYASALYSAATKEKVLLQVEKDLNDFHALMKTDQPLRELLLNPLNKKHVKKSAIDFVLTKKQASPLTINFLNALNENGRLAKFNLVVGAFGVIMAAERGEVTCEVTTAEAMDAATKKEVETALAGFIKKNETIQLTMKVDPAIIGGMLVSIGDKYVDMSIATKVKKYTEAVRGAV